MILIPPELQGPADFLHWCAATHFIVMDIWDNSLSVSSTAALWTYLIACEGEHHMLCIVHMQTRASTVALGLCLSALLQVAKRYLVPIIILCVVREQPDLYYLWLLKSRCSQGSPGCCLCLLDSQ